MTNTDGMKSVIREWTFSIKAPSVRVAPLEWVRDPECHFQRRRWPTGAESSRQRDSVRIAGVSRELREAVHLLRSADAPT